MIQKLETGSSRVSASQMREVAAAMEVPPSFFVEGRDDDMPGTGRAPGDAHTD